MSDTTERDTLRCDCGGRPYEIGGAEHRNGCGSDLPTQEQDSREPHLHAEPMSNWNSDRDYNEGWNAALRAAGNFWGFEPRYSDWTLYLKAQREGSGGSS